MRSLVLAIATVFVLSIGFMVYFWLQKPQQPRGISLTPTTDPVVIDTSSASNAKGLGPGKDGWYQKFGQDGNLSTQFKTDSFTRLRDGRVSLVNPVAEFWTWKANSLLRIIRVEGKTGIVSMNQHRKGTDPLKSNQLDEAPSNGELHDVTVRIEEPDPAGKMHQTMVITMANAWFDNETFKIYTEGYTDPATGNAIAPDMVHVHGVGDDYDFDGNGLTLMWNDRDRRLDLLQIEHGEVLVIKHPHKASSGQSPLPGQSRQAAPLPEMLAGADPQAIAQAIDNDQEPRSTRRRRPHMPDETQESTPATTQSVIEHVSPEKKRDRSRGQDEPEISKVNPSTAPPLYRATFLDNVRIVQSGNERIVADSMGVDFMMKGESATTQPAAPAAEPDHADSPRRESGRSPREPRAAAPTAAAPTTAAVSDEPVYVYWTGRLRMVPLDQIVEIPPGQSIITFVGKPVIAKQTNAELRSRMLKYQTEDGAVHAESDAPGERVMMTSVDARGEKSVIHSETLDYWKSQERAELHGRGDADLPAQENGRRLQSDWTRSCDIHFTPDEQDHDAIDHLVMDGNVHVVHPQAKLNANELDMTFDLPHSTTRPAAQPGDAAPAAQANLRQMIATGKAHCELQGADKKTEVVDSERLTLLTAPGPDGKLVARTVNADGSVHTVDPDQDMHCDNMAMQLQSVTKSSTPNGPTTQSVEIENMTANGHVVVVNKDDVHAAGDTLLVNMVDAKPIAKLMGSPAKIVDKKTTVIGPLIQLNRDQQEMTVFGQGEMHGLQQEAANSSPRPMNVTWTRQCIVNGKENYADAIGKVNADTLNADGTLEHGTGEHVHMILEDRPTTRPATRAAPTTRDSGQPLDLEGSKTVKQAIFYDNAEMRATKLDAQGALLQRTILQGQKIQYDILDQTAPVRKRVTVPGHGQMLMEDYRAPATQPAGGDADDSGRGVTAFEWSTNMVYDDIARQAIADGTVKDPVVIVHRDKPEDPNDMRLVGDRVIADLQPADEPKQPNQDGGEMRMQAKLITAIGHVVMQTRNCQLTALKMTYEPRTRIVTAYGDDRVPAVFTRTGPDAAAGQPLRTPMLRYDMIHDTIKIEGGSGDMQR